jgi:hypothetical protein
MGFDINLSIGSQVYWLWAYVCDMCLLNVDVAYLHVKKFDMNESKWIIFI